MKLLGENLPLDDHYAMLISHAAYPGKVFPEAEALAAAVDGVELDRVWAATLVLNEDADWKAISVDARNADSGLLPRADVPLVL